MKRLKRIVLCALVALFSFLGYDTTSGYADTAAVPVNDAADDDTLVQARRLARLNTEPVRIPVLWTTESYNGKCIGMIDALTYWSPGWDVQRMAGIAYRESRCDPNAANSCCTGILQIHYTWIDNVAMCGVYSRADLRDPWKNICAARVVYVTQGIDAWSTA